VPGSEVELHQVNLWDEVNRPQLTTFVRYRYATKEYWIDYLRRIWQSPPEDFSTAENPMDFYSAGDSQLRTTTNYLLW